LPQLIRWHILGNLRQLFPEFRKAVRAKGKMPEDLDLPFSRHDIVAFHAPSIRAQGAFYASMGSAKTSVIDVRDVDLAAAKALHPRNTQAKPMS